MNTTTERFIPLDMITGKPVNTLTRAERVALAAMKAEADAEAVRLLDDAARDDAAMNRVRDAIGWIW